MTPSRIMLFWGLGGLAAFLILALLPWVNPGLINHFHAFSALILVFLSGSLWLPAVAREDRHVPAISLSMALFVLAWVSFYLPLWLAVLVLLPAYPLLWWQERRWFGTAQPLDYRNLRTLLTWTVVALHILALAAVV